MAMAGPTYVPNGTMLVTGRGRNRGQMLVPMPSDSGTRALNMVGEVAGIGGNIIDGAGAVVLGASVFAPVPEPTNRRLLPGVGAFD